MSTAISSFKVFLMKKSGSSGTAYAKLVDIKSYPDMLISDATLDATTLSDPAHVYIPDIADTGGSMEFTANYNPTDYATLKALEGTESDFAVWFGGTVGSDGTVTPSGSNGKVTFKGSLTVGINGAGVSEVVEMPIRISPTTAPVWASGT